MPIANAANEPRVDHTSAVACSGSGLDYNERAPASWVGGSDLTGTALFVRPLLRLKYKVRERGCCCCSCCCCLIIPCICHITLLCVRLLRQPIFAVPDACLLFHGQSSRVLLTANPKISALSYPMKPFCAIPAFALSAQVDDSGNTNCPTQPLAARPVRYVAPGIASRAVISQVVEFISSHRGIYTVFGRSGVCEGLTLEESRSVVI